MRDLDVKFEDGGWTPFESTNDKALPLDKAGEDNKEKTLPKVIKKRKKEGAVAGGGAVTQQNSDGAAKKKKKGKVVQKKKEGKITHITKVKCAKVCLSILLYSRSNTCCRRFAQQQYSGIHSAVMVLFNCCLLIHVFLFQTVATPCVQHQMPPVQVF